MGSLKIPAFINKKGLEAFFDGLLTVETGIIKNHGLYLNKPLGTCKVMPCLIKPGFDIIPKCRGHNATPSLIIERITCPGRSSF
jgi:hypothetical protein